MRDAPKSRRARAESLVREASAWKRIARFLRCAIFLGTVLASAASVRAQAPDDLTKLKIEDLMSIDVTSVAKKGQKLGRVASAIFVMTQEDIRRSGAMNIPDLLRMVPGLNVAQINGNTWAISARGLNGEFSNELLVLVDGRNVYTPTFGGVFWDTLDVPLEDIEKIEVIRGPGGAVWGANAVNGVINIITKKAGDTKGAMLVAGGGNVNQGFGTAQYGGSAGKSFDYRLYSKYENQEHMPGLTGQDGGDGWHLLRGGLRADAAVTAKDQVMLQGDMYTGAKGSPEVFLPSVLSPGLVNTEVGVNLSGGFFQSVWEHSFSARSETTLAASFDNYQRQNQLRDGRKTFNIDFQHHIAWGQRQDFVWGLVYRYSISRSAGDLFISLSPNDVNSQYFSSFVQDEIAVVPERVYLTAGTKLIHDNYSGFALLPTARVAYMPGGNQTLWAAMSHAVRTPDATDTSFRLNVSGFPGAGGTPNLVAVIGNPKFQNEDLIAYEAGYRKTFHERLSLDLAAYYNDYSHQQTTEPATPFFEATPAPAHLVLPSTYMNLEHGETHGVEVAANWKVTDRWTLSSGYHFERMHMAVSATSQDTEGAENDEEGDPHVQAQVRSHVELPGKWAWDTSAYFVDRILSQRVPSYTRLDAQFSWRWRENVSLSIVGQNLLRDHHLEFIDDAGDTRSTEIKRSAYAKITWRF